jgi:hypothetical protein
MAMQFRVAVEIEGSSPEIFKIGFVFSDEEGSGIEFTPITICQTTSRKGLEPSP